VTWGLHKKVGDAIEYVDESSSTFNVRLAAVMPNSILQGSLVIAEREFEKRFPSQAGYQMLLIDCPPEAVEQVRDHLSRALGDLGLELTPAPRRLAMFTAVEHAYLAIFGALGGLGMLLGTVGLGLVVARNIMERRGELAAFTALGFRKRRLLLLAFTEHGVLLECGLLCAIAAAAFAVWPTLSQHPGDIPWMLLVSLIVAIYLSGMLWVFLATLLALRGRLLDSLRSE
jgi:ABC-type antimicrobial peptide transport system permease subunit